MENRLTPPPGLVCGRKMTAAPQVYFCAQRQGENLYFCTSFCLQAYQADPERFYQAHSRTAASPAQCECPPPLPPSQ